MTQVDVIVIGAGAAGLMCAAQAGYRGRSVTVLDMGKKPGRKILISGGGRCNFTNENATPDNYLCSNTHFVKSRNEVLSVSKTETGYSVITEQETLNCESLVIASGGLTMPKLGATPIGYKIAEQFGLNVLPTMAALVPFTLHQHDKDRFEGLSGISIPCEVSSENGTTFKENILFTHRGLSGPAILQISSFWRAGQAITINLLPEIDLREQLADWRETQAQKSLKNSLATILPKRFIEILHESKAIPDCNINQLTHAQIDELVSYIHAWQIKPNGTEGYRTAEVTLGGVDTDELSSKTFEAKKAKGLYFIGEVTDVTGWLGGYNFQYAWSCGFAAGQYA